MMVSLKMKAFFVGDAADKGASMVYKVKVVNLIDDFCPSGPARHAPTGDAYG
jgi:hypothetical protein